jgi:hypothetical protein
LVFVYTAPKLIVAERVQPRYDSAVTLIYSIKRFLSAGTELRLITNSDVYDVVIDDDDLIPGAAETILEPGFNPAPVKDHDDDTSAAPAASIAAGAIVDHVVWDLGSVASRVLCAKIATNYGTLNAFVLVSSDGSKWTTAVSAGGGAVLAAYYGSFRYVKLQSYNGSTSSYSGTNWKYYSVEVYPPNLRKILVATADMYKMIRVVSRYSSQLLELMRVT